MPLVDIYFREFGREFHHEVKLTNDEVRKHANGILRCMDCGKLRSVIQPHPCRCGSYHTIWLWQYYDAAERGAHRQKCNFCRGLADPLHPGGLGLKPTKPTAQQTLR